MRADEPRAQLHACCAHFQIACNRAATGNAARDENGQLIAQLRQDFLRQNAGRHWSDMPACLTALDNQRIHAGPRKFLRQRERRGKADNLCAERLDCFNASLGR